MSMHSDVTYAVREMIKAIKIQFEKNINSACQNGQLTLEDEKIPGICQLVNDSVDQAFMEESERLVNTLRAYSR